jgi:hypothetical protein
LLLYVIDGVRWNAGPAVNLLVMLHILKSYLNPHSVWPMIAATMAPFRRLWKPWLTVFRGIATHDHVRKEGDISSVFVSLSGQSPNVLPPKYAEIKVNIIQGRQDRIAASWCRLLKRLSTENSTIASRGPAIVPQIEFKDLERDSTAFKDAVRTRGVAIIRGVVPMAEARAYKEEIEEYIALNPGTKGLFSVNYRPLG